MLVLGGMLVLAAVAGGAFRSAALLAATMAVGGVLVEFLKMSPPPPLRTFGDAGRVSSSWPSGHAALQGSIALGLLLWWWAAGLPRPSIVAAIVVPLAMLVGYSRAFLGIHYLSEVLSGWLVATMVAAFVLVIDRLVVPRLRPEPDETVAGDRGPGSPRSSSTGRRGPLGAPLPRSRPEAHFGGLVARAHPSGDHVDSGASTAPTHSGLRRAGRRARSAAEVQRDAARPARAAARSRRGGNAPTRCSAAIAKPGWSEVAPVTPEAPGPDFWAGISGGSAGSRLVAPTFLDTRAADLVLVHPVGNRGMGRGERAEVWELPAGDAERLPGLGHHRRARRPDLVVVAHALPRAPHRSAIDTERDALAGALAAQRALDDLGRFEFVAAGHGHRPGGSYVTDGKVALLRQPACVTPLSDPDATI